RMSIAVTPITRSRRPRRPGQRALLLALVAALALAPLLANIWPALGRGAMLYVSEAVASSSPQAVDHSRHAGPQVHPAPARESHPPHAPGALCVLACLGWAPPVDLSIDGADAAFTDRAAWIALAAPRGQLARHSAQARAPPLS